MALLDLIVVTCLRRAVGDCWLFSLREKMDPRARNFRKQTENFLTPFQKRRSSYDTVSFQAIRYDHKHNKNRPPPHY